MKMTRRDSLIALGATGVAAAVGGTTALADGHATEHVVEMLNQDPDNPRVRMVFRPQILQVNPGDTVKFVAADRGHNTQVDEDMMPDGGTMWESGIGEDVEVTIDVEGAYGYYCTPHRTVGMVGLILVGNAVANYEDLKDVRMRGQAKKRWEEIFDEADALVEASRAEA